MNNGDDSTHDKYRAAGLKSSEKVLFGRRGGVKVLNISHPTSR